MENKQKEADIEVMQKTASAYFERSTPEIKKIVWDYFDKCDEDGNGRITLEEFLKFFEVDAEETISIEEVEIVFKRIETLKEQFKSIDTNGDGSLDFHEFLTFFFISISEGVVVCAGCANFLVNIYFTCHECHSETNNSYDLCADCYSRGNFSHPHSVFLDNLTLLRWYKSTASAYRQKDNKVQELGGDSTNVQNNQTQGPNSKAEQEQLEKLAREVEQLRLASTDVQNVIRNQHRSRRAQEFLKALGIGVRYAGVGVTAAYLCTIM